VRLWTKANHHAIHDLTATKIGNGVADRFWNEHNFVFRKADGLFYHGKGATPNWSGFSNDDDGRTIVPLNMAEPILVLKHRDNKDALGFAPHGAGRNVGRRAFLRENKPGCRPASMPVSTAAGPTCRSCRRLTRTLHRYDRRSRNTASGR